MTNPDPQPTEVPGLEPGGGVRPGDTPPASVSTWGGGRLRRVRLGHIAPAVLIGIGLFVVLIVALVIVGAAGAL